MCGCTKQSYLSNIDPHRGENTVSFSKKPCTCDNGRLTDGRQCPLCKGSGEIDKYEHSDLEEKIEPPETTKK